MKARSGCVLFVIGLLLAEWPSPSRAASMPASGLTLWLKADAITNLVDGDPVGSWPDSSGNGYPATNGGVLQPAWLTNGVNGKPVVRFNGVTNYLQNAAYTPGANDLTLLVVARRNGNPTSGYHNVFIGGPATYKAGANSPGTFYQIYADASTKELRGNLATVGAITSGVPFSSSTFQLLTFWKSNGASSNEFFVDGLSRKTKAGTTSALGGRFYIGNWNNNPFNGDIAEIALYNAALDAGDRQLAEGVMAWKYGLQGSLPAEHTWKNINPANVPEIRTIEPSFISSTNAWMTGHLLSGSFPLDVSVFWGSQDGGDPTNGLWTYTNTFAWAGGAYPATNVFLPTPHVYYYYRFYATNSAGQSWSPASQGFFAADYISWKQTEAGVHDWTNTANWSPEVVPNAPCVIAVITNERAGAQTINVSGTNTLGWLIFGNTNTVALARLAGGEFRFDNGTATPRIVSTNTVVSSDVPITYGSGSLDITNLATVTLSGNLGGFSNLVKRGSGILYLSGNNTYSGDLIAKAGNVYATEYHANLVPDAAWVQLEGGAYFRINKSSETIKGVRGVGSVYINGQPCYLIIGTNAAGATTYDVTLVAGGELRPGYDAAVGDLYVQRSSAASCNAHILGGDIYLDVTGPTTFDRIMFQYGANLISGGNLHLNFGPGYTPTNGSSWDVMARITSGSIADATPGDPLFASIDANIPGRFVAEIVGGITVRVTRADRRGAVILVR